MNSPARMGAAGIKTCGKPFSSVKASKDHTLIPSFPPPRSHTSHSLFLTPFSPSKGRDLKGPWLRENRAREGQLNSPWQPLGIHSAITRIGRVLVIRLVQWLGWVFENKEGKKRKKGQLHQSPPSPIPGELGRGPSHQSHVLEHRDTYRQAQVCSKGHQGSSVDRPCQPSFHWIKFWYARNLPPQSIRLRLSVLVR